MTRLRWQSPYRSLPGKKITPITDAGSSDRWPLSRYILLTILSIVLFLVIVAMVIDKRVSPALLAWAESRAVTLATRAINLAVEETMATSMSMVEMSTIITDAEGKIQAIQYNTGEINRVSSAATHKVVQALLNLGNESFPIPLGQFLGLDFLAGLGPEIPLKVVPAGAVTTTPISSFVAAGINQTIHRIYLEINVDMRIVVPLASVTMPVSTRIPIVEEIIVGSVPSWYFASGGIVGGFDQFTDSRSTSAVEFKLAEP